uniref:OSJNBa0016O02.13 protein n=1 Tax=Oryza sativa subsp. japonica TaxID=39947 RepID=Q7XJV7_ORYSJ|nr:OSJNBa0016O02.13 [Oryza sativa Japonica Group]
MGVREMVLLARWFSNQYVAISRTATSDGRGKFYSALSKTPCLYGSVRRSTKASTINVDKAPSQSLRLLDRSRTDYGYHIPDSSWLNLDRTHHIPCPIRKQPADIGGVPDKERQSEFYMETTRTSRIVSILVSLVLLGQGDTYVYKYKAP